MTPPIPIDYNRLFNRTPSLEPKEQPVIPDPPVEIDFDRLLGRRPGPADTAEKLLTQLTPDALAVSTDPTVQAFDAAVFAPRPAAPPPRRPLSEEMEGVPRIMRSLAEAIGGGRPGETRPERLTREYEEYLHSPEKRAADLENTATIGPAPEGFAKFRQKLASMRLFTDRSLIEFDNGNSSGFHVGIPFAKPIDTAKQLIVGLPTFIADLARQPFKLYVEAATGGQYLLPEEKNQYIKEVVANYAGLIVGHAAGQTYRSMATGRELLKAGVGAAERAGFQVPTHELELIARTLPRALHLESTIPGQIKTGIVEGVAGGATTGTLLGETPEERRNMAATYAMMAIPAGVVFEGIMGRIRGPKLGFHGASAAHAHGLSVLRQMQEAAQQSERNARNSFLALRSASDLASAARNAGVDRPVVVQGVESYQPTGTELVHVRPDGLKDIAFGGIPDIPPLPGEEVVDLVRPEVPPIGSVPEIPDHIRQFTDEQLRDVIAGQFVKLSTLRDPVDQAEVKDLLDVLTAEQNNRKPKEFTEQEIKDILLDPNIIAMARTLEFPDPRRPPRVGDVLGQDIYNPGELDANGLPVLIARAGTRITPTLFNQLTEAGIDMIAAGSGGTGVVVGRIFPPDIREAIVQSSEQLGELSPGERVVMAAGETPVRGRILEKLGEDHYRVDVDGMGPRVFRSADVFPEQAPPRDIVSEAKTGEKSVGATLDKSLLKKLGANLYKSGISSVIVKEALQNAVDAIRPVNGGLVSIDLSEIRKGIFKFKDTGTGMTPEIAANQFMDVGGSAKPGGASGGYGLAKVGLLSNAEHFRMETIAQTKEGKKRTVIEGSSDDWVNGTLKYEVTDAPKTAETGTKLEIQVPREMADQDAWNARRYLENSLMYNRGSAANIKSLNDDATVLYPTIHENVDAVDLDNARVEISHSEEKREMGMYDALNVHVLNNGLYQFSMREPARGVVPNFIIVDVQPKVDVESDSYPFTTSREELKSGVNDWVKGYIKTLAITAARDEAFGLISTLRESPEIPGAHGARLMDTSKKLPSAVFDHVLKDPSIVVLANAFGEGLANIALMLEGRREQLGSSSRTYLNWTNGGIGLGKSYLGLNISSSSLNEVAKAARIPETGISNNVILINPYTIFSEILRADAEAPGEVPMHIRLADHTIGTLVHELIHENARGHDEAFSGLLTRAIGLVLKEGADVHSQLAEAWFSALNVMNNEQTAPAFEQTHEILRKEWETNRDNAFKSISSDLAAPSDVGGPLSGDEGGEQLRPSGPGAPVSGGAEPRPSPFVRGSEQLGAAEGTGATPEPPGAVERRRRQAIATFEVAGFFPNEIVAFLGNEYNYVEPVIGKDGVLTGHIIRDAEGGKIEVPWNSLRHGPDMAINSFIFDKPAARKALVDDFERFIRQEGQSLASKPFAEQVMNFVASKNYNKAMIAPFISFLSDEYGKRLRDSSLVTEEKVAYEKLVREVRKYREDQATNLVDLATSNGMYIERQNGALIIRDSETGSYLELAHSPEEAAAFINNVVEERAADMTPGGVPPGVSRHLLPPPPPPNGPHGSAWTPRYNGWFGELRDLFNVSSVGTHFTGMRQIMISLDNQLKTDFFVKVYQGLQVATQRKYAAMHGDVQRLAGTARIARGLPEERLHQITTSIETMHPDDMIKAGGLFNRPFTPRELAGAKWLIDNQIDLKKAWLYFRALKTLEQKRRFRVAPEDQKIESVRKLQASLAADEGTIEAARIFGRVIGINKPGELSVYAMVRLAEAVMDGHVSPDEYIRRHFPDANTEEGRKMRLVRDEVKSHFADLADTLEIPDEQRLGGYFAHLRNYANDEIIAGRDGAPIFTSELLRTGEMNEYDRDPINVLMRYINAGFSNKYTKAALEEAYEYVNIETARMTDPAHGEYIRKLLTDNYINELRGIPHASSSFFEKLLNGFLDKIGVKSDVNVRRDAVNTFLSLSSSSLIGFRPVQGMRDFHNFTSIYFSRFGAERLGALLTIMSRVTPRELENAGIIAKSQLGESAGAALAREGVTPTLAPVSVLTAQERLQNTISARVAPMRELIQNVADAGIKWGLQHTVYQWAHAAAYLETATRAGDVLTKLATGEYGQGTEAKAKAYSDLFINSYDPPVGAHFDKLVTAGQFKEAADFLGRATSFETVSTFGLANHPAGWGTNSGRLFGQLGSWSVWSRTMLARMLTRGTPQERTRVAVRFGMTQGGLAAASGALGLNLNSWYLPGMAPLASGLGHAFTALQSYDDEQTEEMQRAAAAIVLGVPGSLLFRGGPAFSAVATGVAAGQAYPQAEREAADALLRLPALGVPGSQLLRDLYLANEMAQNGNNPVSVWLRALGIPSTPNESLLNPGGAILE